MRKIIFLREKSSFQILPKKTIAESFFLLFALYRTKKNADQNKLNRRLVR